MFNRGFMALYVHWTTSLFVPVHTLFVNSFIEFYHSGSLFPLPPFGKFSLVASMGRYSWIVFYRVLLRTKVFGNWQILALTVFGGVEW